MPDLRKLFCLILTLSMTVSAAVMPVYASDMETEIFQETRATELEQDLNSASEQPASVPEETVVPEETQLSEPEETVVSEETEPSEPEETVVSEETEPFVPEETVPVETEPEVEETPETWKQVPLFFQTDYPEVMYGSGSIATSGCSVTALAMVATYLTGHTYLPDELARYFGGTAESNIARLENGSSVMRLPCQKSENFHETMQALRDGKVAIALMTGKSIFSSMQHCIVLTGLNENGKIMVNDPYGPNYEKWDLKRAFQEGFDEDDILCGYDGAWIYDKSAMPEEPFLYQEPVPVRGAPRYPDICLSLEEKKLLARMVWVEARGESLEGQQAVAEVVLNRMASEDFPNTLEGVIYAEGQFRSVKFLDDAEPYQAQFEAIENAMYGPYVLPENVMYFASYPVNNNVWGEIGGHIFCYFEE